MRRGELNLRWGVSGKKTLSDEDIAALVEYSAIYGDHLDEYHIGTFTFLAIYSAELLARSLRRCIKIHESWHKQYPPSDQKDVATIYSC